MPLIHHLCYALVLVCATGCSHHLQTPAAPAPAVKITILHTNDHHGRFWKNADGEYGMAARKTVVDAIRREVADGGGYSLLLDGGDVNTGVPESDLQDAVPDFKGMNLLGYDAMAVGNHEFDKPPQVLRLQRKLAKFPMLSANIYQGDTRLFDPYKIFNVGGVRVAVMGLTTEDTKRLTNPENTQGVEFRSPIAEAARLMPELQAKADVIIAATHMGHYEDGRHGSLAPGDVEMARAVKGLDLIVGGHSQNPACMRAENVMETSYVPGTACAPDRQNGAWIVQAHEWGKYVGRADFEYQGGTFKLLRYVLVPINLKRITRMPDGTTVRVPYTTEIAEDPAMLDLLAPHQTFGQQQLLVQVGSSDALLEGDRSVIRKKPTSLGVLIATAFKERTQSDFAVINAGGIRDSLPAGDISYKDILTVHPFGNTVAVLQLRGAEVIDYLQAAAKFTPGAGGFAHFAGVEMRIHQGQIDDVRIAGRRLNLDASYRMAINNFMAAGGDGYPVVTQHPGYVNTGFLDAEVMRTYITKNSPLSVSRYEPGQAVVRE
ncbi:MAG: bifunctional UDP-sugar hydrolase/5'-nucleotidase [Burkholderiales bacterium PBB4]|nr:MAG: bifunctional UDP-sugar hydrolase/5'-nucleotidase [Burkholderiales bacterium PBB4]